MSTATALLIFAGSLVLSLLASVVLTERLDQVGERFRFSAGLLGLVTALGADAPEIASAVTALTGGQHDLGQGVIFGSNIFNVAFLLGFSALAAGRVAVGWANLALNGGVALGVTASFSCVTPHHRYPEPTRSTASGAVGGRPGAKLASASQS